MMVHCMLQSEDPVTTEIAKTCVCERIPERSIDDVTDAFLATGFCHKMNIPQEKSLDLWCRATASSNGDSVVESVIIIDEDIGVEVVNPIMGRTPVGFVKNFTSKISPLFKGIKQKVMKRR